MSFFSNPGIQDPKKGRNPKDNPSTLRIFIDQNTGEYSYKFIKPSFLLWHPDDTITFIIKNEIPNATTWITTHLSTDHTDINNKMKVMPVHHQAGAEPGKNEDDPVDDIENHYMKKLNKIRFKLNTKKHELVFLGVIVAIQQNDPDFPIDYLLCDPQVGNGPPVSP